MIKKLQETSLPLLSRKELILEIDYPKAATPPTSSILKDLVSNLKIKEELIKIKHIYPIFGQQKAKIIASVYDSKEKLEKFESIAKRKKKTKEESPAEQPQKIEFKSEQKEIPKKEVKEKV